MRTNRACGYLKEQLRAKRSVPSMQILVRVVSPPVVAEFVPGPGGPGKRFIFSEDFCLKGTTAQRKITNSLARIPGS
jgi:hypothetical protein